VIVIRLRAREREAKKSLAETRVIVCTHLYFVELFKVFFFFFPFMLFALTLYRATKTQHFSINKQSRHFSVVGVISSLVDGDLSLLEKREGVY
jgi:hypothetical protein